MQASPLALGLQQVPVLEPALQGFLVRTDQPASVGGRTQEISGFQERLVLRGRDQVGAAVLGDDLHRGSIAVDFFDQRKQATSSLTGGNGHDDHLPSDLYQIWYHMDRAPGGSASLSG